LLGLQRAYDGDQPLSPPVSQLADFLEQHAPVLALTGAGISTASGIPSYRDQFGEWQRSDPIQHNDFITLHTSRQLYWSRSMAGWHYVRDARPNLAHYAMRALEEAGYISLIVTQNVDRLHQRAGSMNTIDLHGRLDRVMCLSCGDPEEREQLQARLEKLNPHIAARKGQARPDGDAEIEEELVDSMQVPQCRQCAGKLMPDVVFYGGAVPRHRVNRVSRALEQANGLLIVGSSLQAFSGYRFCKQAREWGRPIAAVNRGATRADPLLNLKLNQDCVEVFRELNDQMDLPIPRVGRNQPY
jgi:NAD-dependent SIR2 family protein deacetylase